MRVYSLFAIMLLVSACANQLFPTQPESAPRHEITKEDIFAIEGIKGNQVEVFGVGIGDSKERVLARLGEPDKIMEFPDIETVNFEYASRLNMTNPGLVVQLQKDKVSKITFKKPFNQHLKGQTIIDHDKEAVYFDLLGVPDRQEEVHLFRVFYYEDEGFEAILRKGQLNGFSLVSPQDVTTPKRMVDPVLLAQLQADSEQSNI